MFRSKIFRLILSGTLFVSCFAMLSGCGEKSVINSSEDIVNFWEDEKAARYKDDANKIIERGISEEEKAQIDKWIEDNGLNQYGDPKTVMYAGGTPLFNESTGEITDRYEYILSNHPELVGEFD